MSDLSLFFKKLFQKINTRGIDVLNDFFPQYSNGEDKYSEWVKSFIIIGIIFSLIMMSSYPPGWMYACFPRPFSTIVRFIWNDYTDIEYYPAPTPEWGLHYTTIVTYGIFMYLGIKSFEKDRIDKPFFKLAYVSILTIVTLMIPFEVTYITLYDVFHSIPKFGEALIWNFGLWESFPKNILDSVVLYDVGLPIIGGISMYMIIKELRTEYNIKFRFDRVSLSLLILFFLTMFAWVIIPVHTDVVGWGTKWFPQTIYIDYGYFADYNITHAKTDWGIVTEYWYPNDMIKYHNIISKLVSVLFMFYTFIPRNVRNKR